MNDVRIRYKAGGSWKTRIFARQGKHRHEATRPGRVYIAIPPVEGWPGGLPENNGYRRTGGK